MDLLLAAMPPPAHKTLAAWATDRLREEILSGRLAPGRRLYEQELASAMHISRTPIRDALRALEREHLVTIAPNHETVVTRTPPPTCARSTSCGRCSRAWPCA